MRNRERANSLCTKSSRTTHTHMETKKKQQQPRDTRSKSNPRQEQEGRGRGEGRRSTPARTLLTLRVQTPVQKPDRRGAGGDGAQRDQPLGHVGRHRLPLQPIPLPKTSYPPPAPTAGQARRGGGRRGQGRRGRLPDASRLDSHAGQGKSAARHKCPRPLNGRRACVWEARAKRRREGESGGGQGTGHTPRM